jgi:hypothetical protein
MSPTVLEPEVQTAPAPAKAAKKEPVFKETIPMWLAVCITVALSLPFGTYLGKFNFSLWVSFIVWAEYFALGAKPAALKIIFPAFAASSLWTGFMVWLITPFSGLPSFFAKGDLAVQAAFFVGVGIMVYCMKFFKTFQVGSLAYFNGMSMCLGVIFTGSAPKIALLTTHPQSATFVAAVWCIAMGWFGAILGWFNVVILFPKEVKE